LARASTTAAATAATDADKLLDLVLYGVSHDLKSPLLTLLLSGELIAQALPDSGDSGDSGDRARIALDGLKHGAKDLERMLDAVTAVSRARRRPLEEETVLLVESLGAHGALSEWEVPDGLALAVDRRVIGEVLATLAGDEPSELVLKVDVGAVELSAPLPDGCPQCDGSPLEALLQSLTTYAGTAVEELAALQTQLERQGGTVTVDDAGAHVRLPLAAAE
jgi:signal transduction histidine kinase